MMNFHLTQRRKSLMSPKPWDAQAQHSSRKIMTTTTSTMTPPSSPNSIKNTIPNNNNNHRRRISLPSDGLMAAHGWSTSTSTTTTTTASPPLPLSNTIYNNTETIPSRSFFEEHDPSDKWAAHGWTVLPVPEKGPITTRPRRRSF